MMNILEIQDALKSMSNEQLIREIRMPSGSAPPFLVASEMDRRQNMRQRFAEKQPQSTVIDDLTMQMNRGIGGMMPQPMPMNQPMGMPKSSPELMPARGMFLGGRILSGLAGLRNFFGRGAKPAVTGSADDVLVSPTGIASRRNQGIGSTIPPNQQLIPYSAGNVIPYQPSVSAGAASPSLFQKGLGALRTGGKFLLGATPVAGLQNLLLTSSMGDGTMVAKIMSDFGLTEEEALLLEQELLKRGKDFYTDKQELQPFADSIIATRPGGPGLKTEQEMAVEQQKQKEKTLIDMLRERDERNRSIAGLQTGLDLIARGAAGEPLGTALPASVGKIFLPALSKMGETELKLMLDRETRKAAALAKQKGTTKDLIDYRQDLAKQLTDPTTSLALTAEQKKIISDTLERLDAIIQSRVGIGSSGGTSSLDTMEAIRAALGAKTASVKG